MTDSEQGGIILLVLCVLLLIGFIYAGISSSIEKKTKSVKERELSEIG